MSRGNGQTTVEGLSQAAKNKAMQIRGAAQKTESRMSEAAEELSQNIGERVQQLSDQLQQVSYQVRDQAKMARDKTSETVSKHPFYSIGAAALLGLGLGFLLRRRK
ncbi:DUF883 family protein [bacterium]|nr:DUF883 family protein [bacterium]